MELRQRVVPLENSKFENENQNVKQAYNKLSYNPILHKFGEPVEENAVREAPRKKSSYVHIPHSIFFNNSSFFSIIISSETKSTASNKDWWSPTNEIPYRY